MKTSLVPETSAKVQLLLEKFRQAVKLGEEINALKLDISSELKEGVFVVKDKTTEVLYSLIIKKERSRPNGLTVSIKPVEFI